MLYILYVYYTCVIILYYNNFILLQNVKCDNWVDVMR